MKDHTLVQVSWGLSRVALSTFSSLPPGLLGVWSGGVCGVGIGRTDSKVKELLWEVGWNSFLARVSRSGSIGAHHAEAGTYLSLELLRNQETSLYAVRRGRRQGNTVEMTPASFPAAARHSIVKRSAKTEADRALLHTYVVTHWQCVLHG